MAITKEGGRQWTLLAKVNIGFADVADDSGVALEAVDLPAGAIPLRASLTVTEVFDSATSDTLAVSGGGLTLGATDLQALGTTPVVVDSTPITALTAVSATWTGAGAAATQGAAFLTVEYARDGKANEVQPV